MLLKNKISTTLKTMTHRVFTFLIDFDSIIEQPCSDRELDSLIHAFTSPIPDHILTDYDNKSKKRHKQNGENQESALEHFELKGPVFREFTIHIFQSISFL